MNRKQVSESSLPVTVSCSHFLGSALDNAIPGMNAVQLPMVFSWLRSVDNGTSAPIRPVLPATIRYVCCLSAVEQASGGDVRALYR
jgi:hypothetical protein